MSKSRTGSQRRFARSPAPQIPRSKFDRSHGLKTAFDGGDLVPIFLDEVVPGDTFTMRASFVARFGTLLAPIMDRVYLDTFFFFAPMRILWDDALKFFGEEENPGASTDFEIPLVTLPAVTGALEGSIYDYMGVPPGVASLEVNVLPFRAYNRIWSDWFRVEHSQTRPTLLTHGGGDSNGAYFLRKRNKRHDYFTSAHPAPQRGADIQIPVGNHPVVAGALATGVPTWSNDGGTTVITLQGTTNDIVPSANPVGTGDLVLQDSNLVIDGSDSVGATINQLREAVQLQRWFEKQARGGTRYPEIIATHFKIRDAGGDARLQRTEYLGGSSQLMSVVPVPQQGETGSTPQANLAAYGVMSGRIASWTKTFTEHGYILGLANVRADLHYQQGLNRLFNRRTKLDFYWPSFAFLGEQAIAKKEIYAAAGQQDDVWGYQERYAEYRYKPSEITGIMRSTASSPLDIWHCAVEFSSEPVFSSSFFNDDPPFDRIVATPSEPHIILDAYFQLICARPMPTFSVPGMMDHF